MFKNMKKCTKSDRNIIKGRIEGIKISGSYSDCKDKLYTVLTPIQFLSFSYHIGNYIYNDEVICYADDRTLMFSSDNWIDVRK